MPTPGRSKVLEKHVSYGWRCDPNARMETICWTQIGAKFGHFVFFKYVDSTALLWRILKLSRVMSCYVMLKLYVGFCSAMWLVLRPEMLSPQ